MGFPGGSTHPGNARNTGSISGLGRPPKDGNGNSLQYSCLDNLMDEESGGVQSMGLKRVTQFSN